MSEELKMSALPHGTRRSHGFGRAASAAPSAPPPTPSPAPRQKYAAADDAGALQWAEKSLKLYRTAEAAKLQQEIREFGDASTRRRKGAAAASADKADRAAGRHWS